MGSSRPDLQPTREFATSPVYITDTDLFTVYADRKLQTPALLGEIVHGFGLVEQSFVTRSDAYYRSSP